MTFIEPLDLETILIDKLAGSPLIFLILFFIVLTIASARFRMPSIVYFTLLFIGSVFLYATNIGLGSGLIVGLIVVGVLLVIFALAKTLAKVVQ